MNKKRILSYVLTVGIIFGVANVAYASENLANDSKPVVVEAETKSEFLSDEEAVSIANEAMKYYLNIDTNCFNGTEITRFNRSKNVEVEVDGQKYMVDSSWGYTINNCLKYGNIEGAKDTLQYALEDTAPSTIFVEYIDPEAKDGEYRDNEVTINAETGEVIRISKHHEFEEFNEEIDKNKIKEAATSFLEKSNLTAVPETKWDDMFLFPNEGEATLCLRVNGGMVVDVTLDLEDLSVINFYKVSIMYPNQDLNTL